VSYTRYIGKFLDCYFCNCLSERRWEGRLRSHCRKPIESVCHATPHCEHESFLHEFFFSVMFPFGCNGRQNRAMCLHQVLHEAL
jgi:hypothetical protein